MTDLSDTFTTTTSYQLLLPDDIDYSFMTRGHPHLILFEFEYRRHWSGTFMITAELAKHVIFEHHINPMEQWCKETFPTKCFRHRWRSKLKTYLFAFKDADQAMLFRLRFS